MQSSPGRSLLQLLVFLPLLYVVLGQDGCRDPSSDDQRAVMIGQSVCFICPQGTANIEWKYELAPVNLEPGLTDFPNGTLLIASVQSNYIGRPFSCRNTNTLSQTSFSLTEASISAPTVEDKVINETGNVFIRCQANAKPIPHTITWIRNGETVSTISVLQLSNITRSQAGVYTCNTVNSIGSASANITITVQYRPSSTLTAPSPVQWMRNHTLTCSFDGVPTPSVTWKVNTTEIQSGNQNYVIQTMDSSSYLDIVGTELTNSGQYTCSVENLIASSSDMADLVVQVPPDPPVGFVSGRVGTGGFQLTWMTQFDGNSPITSALVMYRIKSDNPASATNVTADGTTMYTLSGLRANTLYTVTVYLVNAVGQSSGGMHEVMTLSLPPLQPKALAVTAVSSTQLQVTWQLPDPDLERSDITSWELEYREESTPNFTSIPISDASTRSQDLPRLKKGTRYFVRLRGINSGGNGTFSDEVTQRTRVDRPSKPRVVFAAELNAMSVKLQWMASEDDGGSPLSIYRVELKNVTGGETTFRIVGSVTHPMLDYTIGELVPEIAYEARVAAKNEENDQFGPASDVLPFTTPKLNYPPNPGVKPDFTTLTDTSVRIIIPELTGIITNFTIEYKLRRVSWGAPLSKEVPASVKVIQITDLAPNSPYEVRFFTKNSLGISQPSPVLSFTTGPSLDILMTPKEDFVQGGNIILECRLSADKSNPTGVTWLKDNEPVDEQNLPNVVLAEHRLTISGATEEHNGVYVCRHTVNGAVVTSEAVISIQTPSPAPTPTPRLTLAHIIIIAVSCAAGGGLILLVIVLTAVIICFKCRSSSEGNYKISSKNNAKNKTNWIEVSGENDTGMVYMSSHYPTVRTQDSRAQIEGTPFDYQPPEDLDHQPFSTFSTMERKHHLRTASTEPHGHTPEPPVIAPTNPMHIVSLDGSREDIIEDTV